MTKIQIVLMFTSHYSMFKETWKNHFEFLPGTWCCIWTRVASYNEAVDNICLESRLEYRYDIDARLESFYQQFITERLEDRSNIFPHLSQMESLKYSRKSKQKGRAQLGRKLF